MTLTTYGIVGASALCPPEMTLHTNCKFQWLVLSEAPLPAALLLYLTLFYFLVGGYPRRDHRQLLGNPV